MLRNEGYNTKQKNKILNIIKLYGHEFTVKDIYNDLNKEIGLTTIYRYIDKLNDDGVVIKSIGKNNITYYQYLEECKHKNHFYLKCINCGVMDHIDCDCIVDLTNHIMKNHKFKLSKEHIIINGICDKCIKERKYEEI